MFNKLVKYILKYFTLFVLFALLIKLTIWHYDYCSTVYNIFIIPIISLLILLNIIVLYIIDFKKNTFKITNLTLSVFLFLLGINLIRNYFQSEKKIAHNLLVLPNYNVGLRGFAITLFKDNTYEVNGYGNHVSCHYFGNYNLTNDTLKLSDKKISEKTSKQLTNIYIFNKLRNRFEPPETEFPYMKFEE